MMMMMMTIILLQNRPTKPFLSLLIPFPYYTSYPSEYNWLMELFIRPKSSPFVETNNIEFYKTWNGEALINFKWRVYGKYYYMGIWLLYIIFLTCFIIASSISNLNSSNDYRNYFLIASIVLGCVHLSFEIRQFIWNPYKWLSNFWNLFGIY